MFNSIKSKVIVTYSLVIIAFTSALLIIAVITEKENIIKLELNDSAKVAELHANLLNQEFLQYVSMLQMISADSQVRSGNLTVIKRKLKRLVKVGRGHFINALYIDNKFNMTDIKGYTGHETRSFFTNTDQWKHKTFHISSAMKSKLDHIPVIFVAVPILNEDNLWLGTLAATVPLTTLSTQLSSIKLTKGSYAWLADANGLIVSHPNKESALKLNLNAINKAHYPGFDEIFKQAQKRKNGYGRYSDTLINKSKIVTYSTIDSLPDWDLFVTTEESEIFYDLYVILYDVLITAIILMLIFLLLVSQLSNRITNPIIRLTRDVKLSIARQENEINIINSKDEIGKLSQAFYNAFYKINLHTNHLKELVRIRTEEVEAKNKTLSEQNNKLEELASIDPLTGFYNRRAFTVFVENEVSRATRHNSPISLAVVDIDHFKKINDAFGHDVGDDILRSLSEQLTKLMRKENVICRWGGEEFVILIPEASSKTIFQYLDNVREKISQVNFSPVESLTVSIGIATMQKDEEFQSWFKRADKLLYDAKNAGRNRVLGDH